MGSESSQIYTMLRYMLEGLLDSQEDESRIQGAVVMLVSLMSIISGNDDVESIIEMDGNTRDWITGILNHLPESVYDDSFRRARFHRHLQHARKVVKTWPAWKQNLLGPL